MKGTRILIISVLFSLINTISGKNLKEPEQLYLAEKRVRRTFETPFIRPETAIDDSKDLVEMNFEDADLQNILDWIAKTFNVSFLADDNMDPAGKYPVANKKISFKTHEPLTKKAIWDLFLSFLDLWGLALKKNDVLNLYQVLPSQTDVPHTISRAPLPAYINIDWKTLPNNDAFIRYVYFVQNSTLANIYNIVNTLRSNKSTLSKFDDLDAFIITDKSANVRSLMQIVEALDSATMPEQMSVLKLKNADAEDVVNLYQNLTKQEDPRNIAARLFGSKKVPTKMYFPESAQIIAEPRSNAIIILGTREDIEKIEDFIINHVDTKLSAPYSPLYVYELQYADAEDIVNILNQVTKFSPNSTAAQFGGVRGNDKYFQPMMFEPEKSGNKIIIRAEKEDYLKVRDIIRQLDIKQPQVAIEVLVVEVIANDHKELGVQIRNKEPNTPFKNADFQNSGLPLNSGFAAPQVDPTSGSIVTSLIGLASGQTPGSLLISIGNAATLGVWGIFKILQQYVHTEVLSNPFMVTTNTFPAEVSVGETRRIAISTVLAGANPPQDTFGDSEANLDIKVTPRINTDGIINLSINFELTVFSSTEVDNGNKVTHTITTNANVANGEVLAFGGLLKTNNTDTLYKVPVLGDIPLLGWLFKNKAKDQVRDNILVFISPHIIEPQLEGGMAPYSQNKIDEAKAAIDDLHAITEKRDPIHRWFFKDTIHTQKNTVDEFVNKNYEKKMMPNRSTSSIENTRSTSLINCVPQEIKLQGALDAQ